MFNTYHLLNYPNLSLSWRIDLFKRYVLFRCWSIINYSFNFSWTRVKENKILTVNVLGAHHQQISNVFSSKMGSEDRFKHGNWTELKTGAPILEDALVGFDCQIEQIQEVGTHTIFICRVVAIQQGEHEQGLAYFNRAYHHVGEMETA